MLRELLSEKGDLSMMRLLSLIAELASVGIAYFGMLRAVDMKDLAILCGTFLSTGFGAKLTQKIMER